VEAGEGITFDPPADQDSSILLEALQSTSLLIAGRGWWEATAVATLTCPTLSSRKISNQ